MKLSWPRRARQAAAGSAPPLASTQAVRLVEPFVIDADLLSDVGCVRTNNEDSGRIVRDTNNTSGSAASHDRVLVIVADGMGGYNAGEIASALAAETLESAFPDLLANPMAQLKAAVVRANQRIYGEAEADTERNGMGTTCTALLLQDGNAYSAHIGDSRTYLLRSGGMYLVTEDHSQVMEMVKAGVLSLQEARHHPDKNVITRALGRQPEIDVATWPQPMPIQLGDGFLLCSDGLCDVLEDDEMNAIAQRHSAADACEELVRLAKARNASDNITVAVVKLVPASKAAGAPATPAFITSNDAQSGSRQTRRVEIEP